MNQFVVFDDNLIVLQAVDVDSINIDGNNVTWDNGSSVSVNANFGLFVSGNANVGDVLPSGNALSIVQNTKIAQLNQDCQNAIYQGFECVPDTTTGVSYHFPFDDQAQSNYTQYSVQVLCGNTASEDWKVRDGTGTWMTLTITSTNFQNNVISTASSYKKSMINKYRSYVSQVMSAITIQGVKEINWS